MEKKPKSHFFAPGQKTKATAAAAAVTGIDGGEEKDERQTKTTA